MNLRIRYDTCAKFYTHFANAQPVFARFLQYLSRISRINLVEILVVQDLFVALIDLDLAERCVHRRFPRYRSTEQSVNKVAVGLQSVNFVANFVG